MPLFVNLTVFSVFAIISKSFLTLSSKSFSTSNLSRSKPSSNKASLTVLLEVVTSLISLLIFNVIVFGIEAKANPLVKTKAITAIKVAIIVLFFLINIYLLQFLNFLYIRVFEIICQYFCNYFVTISNYFINL